MKKAGYDTYMTSKWHIRQPVIDKLFTALKKQQKELGDPLVLDKSLIKK